MNIQKKTSLPYCLLFNCMHFKLYILFPMGKHAHEDNAGKVGIDT